MTEPVTLVNAAGQPLLTTSAPATSAAGSAATGLVDAAGQPLVSVAARVSPLRQMLGIARENWPFLVAAGVAAAFIAILETTFNEEEAVQAIQEWKLAARYLVNQDGSFDQAMPNFIDQSLPAEVWTADDRKAFDTFITTFTNEIVAIANALELNADELEKARSGFHDVVSGLLEVLVPVCLLSIAVIPLQFFPATAPYAEAVGVAGAVITVAAVAMFSGDLTSILGAIAAGFTNNSTVSFVKGAHPGNLPPGAPDQQLKDIKIDWAHNQDFYMKPRPATG